MEFSERRMVKVSLPPFVVEDAMRLSNAKENSLNIEFFFSLHIDLTRIYDAFLNF